ncbi:hypothetical protein AMECASPLE_010664 [Ameca splendens]|uniref:Uncharacterized protein n=2 Tax=Goodeidae TaxID=28758 RepID=A0ABU7EJ42_9TELE|nr:hypothetical protein [Characodon lateralis]
MAVAVMHSISKMWGGSGRVGECHFQVSSQHSSLMRDGFCSTDSQGDQEKGPSPPPLHPSPPPLRSPILQGADSSSISFHLHSPVPPIIIITTTK